MTTHEGGCLCGAVRYASSGEPYRQFVCHCRDCQRSGGSAFHIGLAVPRSGFRVTQGELQTYESTSDSGRRIKRHFCPTCGSGVLNEPEVWPDHVVIRGLGPSLSASGVPNTLQNPTLELHNGDGVLLFTNNDWQDNPSNAAEVAAAGLAPSDSRESAIAVNLPPGAYTAIVRGVNNGTGVALVEVFGVN